MKNNQLKQMMSGALLLSVAALFAKVLSAVYRVPFQNMVGNTGFYVYQQVYPLYGIGMTFALSGFPVFFSKAIAEARNFGEQRRLIRHSFVILSLFSVLIFMGIYGFAESIACFMGDGKLTPIIQSVSWMFLFMPILATYRGYFQGTYRMEPTAFSQVAEQLVRVMVILAAAYFYTISDMDLYQMGEKAMSGAIWGAVVSVLILVIAVVKEPWHVTEGQEAEKLGRRPFFLNLARRYLTEGITICLLTSILVLFQLVDSFTLYKGLVENGILDETAKSLKGIYDRGQPLVQLGMVVGTGFSTSFIPLMSQAFSLGREDHFNQAAKSLIRITATFSLAATAGLLAILPEVNHMLFGDRSGNIVLGVYVVSIAAASLVMAYHSILQSYNQYLLTLYALAIGLAVKLVANLFLVPYWNTLGASLATLLGLGVMVLFLGSRMPLSLKGVWQKDQFLKKLAGGGFLLFAGAFSIKGLLSFFFNAESRTSASIVALLTVGAGVVLFGGYVLRVRLFTVREWLSIPMGKKLLKKFSKSIK